MSKNRFYSRTKLSRDDLETPDYFFKLLDNEFHFTLDPCSSETNHKCDKYFTIKKNGLKQNWKGEIAFVNPPFSKKVEWLEKAYSEGKKSLTTVVMIIPVATETEYFKEICWKSYEIRFCYKRVIFLLNGKILKNGSTFGLMILVFNSNSRNSPIISLFNHR